MLPFFLMLATIALAPLFFADWWRRQYPKVSFALAAVVGYIVKFTLPYMLPTLIVVWLVFFRG